MPTETVDTTTNDPVLLALIAEITAARIELLASIDELKGELTPAAFAKRGLGVVAGAFVDENGGVRPKRIAAVAGTLASVVALKVLGRIRRD
ncbi:MAG: DUF3618 domain-containing protein [Actinomycetota bacterium]|nr:DUF3618 domain-containing protein [Actinomycetota bacterium]